MSKKSPQPRCEHCDRNVARKTTATGLQLCEGCYYAWLRGISTATRPKSGSWIGDD